MTQPGSRISKHLQKTFSVKVISIIDDVEYSGSFVVKKLTLRDLAALGVRKAQLNGGMHFSEERAGQGVDYQTDELNGMIAHLELAVVDAPKWWKLDELVDTDILMAVYKEVLAFENSFHRRNKLAQSERADDAGRASGSPGAGAASVDDRDGRAVVQRDVLAALEP